MTLLDDAQESIQKAIVAARHAETYIINKGAQQSQKNVLAYCNSAFTDIQEYINSLLTPPVITVPSPAGIPGDWGTPIFAEEMDGTDISQSWAKGWWPNPDGLSQNVGGPNAMSCYDAKNVTVADGALSLAFIQKATTLNDHTYQYSGSLVSTNPQTAPDGKGFTYMYGARETRMFVPGTPDGTKLANWPSVWSNAESDQPWFEIDTFEALGGSGQAHFHANGYGNTGLGNLTAPGWHTFGSLWTPNSIEFFYDGESVGKVTPNIPAEPNYLILGNDSAGGDTLVCPTTALVDYDRVWQAQ